LLLGQFDDLIVLGKRHQFSGNGVGLTNLPGSALTGVLPPTALPSSVAQLPANQTFTGSNNFTTSVGIGTSHPTALLQLNSTNQLSEPLRLSGQERYNAGFTASDGISLLLGVNRVGNRQLWIGDSAALTPNSTNSVLRIIPSTAGAEIDSVGTDGLTAKPLTLAGGTLTINPGADVIATGHYRLGPGGTNYAASSPESVRIIRGIVSPTSTGEVYNGRGFTIISNDATHFTIAFTIPFADLPAVTLTGAGATASWTSILNDRVDVELSNLSVPANGWYGTFIAVGAQ